MQTDFLKRSLMDLPSENGGKDSWSIDDATKGVAILGGTGSGKTSASGKTIALKYLREGWGGIVLCAKPEEAALWESYCNEANRAKDLIIFEKKSKHKEGDNKGEDIVFNPIDYELKRGGNGGGDTQNITNIFMNIYRMGNRIASEGDISKEERFWDSALKRLISRTAELLKLSEQDLSISNLCKVLISCSAKVNDELVVNRSIIHQAIRFLNEQQDPEDLKVNFEEEEIYYCCYCLALADKKLRGKKEQISEDEFDDLVDMYDSTYNYFVNFFNTLDERTKSTIIEMFMGLAEPFLSGILKKHFAGRTNIFPEWTFQKQKIIVLNFPVKEFLDVGIISQCVFKLMFQQAIERRDINKYPMPVFLWADEAQLFVNPYDQIFLTTARSSRTATVFLTQNISNYLAVMGSGNDSKAKVDSLLGNLSTKIFHANMDAETNEYASRLIGNEITAMESASKQVTSFSMADTKSLSYSMQLIPQVLPKEFTTLRSGGENNEYRVEAVIMVSGKKWLDGKNFKRVIFKQNLKI